MAEPPHPQPHPPPACPHPTLQLQRRGQGVQLHCAACSSAAAPCRGCQRLLRTAAAPSCPHCAMPAAPDRGGAGMSLQAALWALQAHSGREKTLARLRAIVAGNCRLWARAAAGPSAPRAKRAKRARGNEDARGKGRDDDDDDDDDGHDHDDDDSGTTLANQPGPADIKRARGNESASGKDRDDEGDDSETTLADQPDPADIFSAARLAEVVTARTMLFWAEASDSDDNNNTAGIGVLREDVAAASAYAWLPEQTELLREAAQWLHVPPRLDELQQQRRDIERALAQLEPLGAAADNARRLLRLQAQAREQAVQAAPATLRQLVPKIAIEIQRLHDVVAQNDGITENTNNAPAHVVDLAARLQSHLVSLYRHFSPQCRETRTRAMSMSANA